MDSFRLDAIEVQSKGLVHAVRRGGATVELQEVFLRERVVVTALHAADRSKRGVTGAGDGLVVANGSVTEGHSGEDQVDAVDSLAGGHIVGDVDNRAVG